MITHLQFAENMKHYYSDLGVNSALALMIYTSWREKKIISPILILM